MGYSNKNVSSVANDVKILQQDINNLKQNGGVGGGVLSFQTLVELQQSLPNGNSNPVWVVSENSWYYWDGSTATDNTPPNNVTNLIASNITGTTVILSWTASTSNDTTGYDIYNGSTFITTVIGTTYNVSGLSQSTSYTFWVKAKDGSGNVASGTSVNVTTTNTIPSDTTPPVVTANPNGGTFSSSQNITLSASETATIYYTLDGTTPTISSPVYSNPINISNTTTLKYIGKDSAGNISSVQTQVYTINQSFNGYVNDSSMLMFVDHPATGMSVTSPELYFNNNEEFTYAVTVKPNVADTAFLGRMSIEFRRTIQDKFYVTITGFNTTTSTDTFPSINTATTFPDMSVFYHIVLVRTSTQLLLYVNNIQVGSTGLGSNINIKNQGAAFNIGKTSNPGTFLNTVYYKRALTTAELTQNYSALKG
ncbi:hypothetical protein COE51_16295 [Bacillus pseudomycoides]|nr:hypothetical protein COE51_16295 [Bacillus pseudomycoides]